MALAESQKISRVLSGQPFGDGRDGSLTISSNTTQTHTSETCTGTSGTTSLTAGGTSLSNDDVVLIWQTRGTGAGNWEINKVASGGGTTSLTMAENLIYTYSSGAQIIKIPLYDEITVNSSQVWSPPVWNGSKGGILVAAANVSTVANGILNTDGDGFRKAGRTNNTGQPSCSPGDPNQQGEGDAGAGGSNSQSANGSGGGGGLASGTQAAARNASGGGGGGNLAGNTAPTQAGSNSPVCSAQSGGTGGSASGNSELTEFSIGGAGGTGGDFGDENLGNGVGGNGAAGIMIFTKDFDISSGSASLDGEGGGAGANAAGGGGGAGGSMLIMGETVDMGSSVVAASGGSAGARGNGGGAGGAGGDGRIAVHYSGSVTGTTSPTLNSTEDSSLAEVSRRIFTIS